jgi:hypothetical protein
MMRTVEVLIVIIIITGAFVTTMFFAVLPWPRQVSPVNLRRLSLTTLQTMDSGYDLSLAAFNPANQTLWNNVQVALSASLPPNILYNLTVYNVNSAADDGTLYSLQKSITNADSLGISTDASSYLASSANVTFNVTPEKIGESNGSGGITLYILNCSDANGWWITGYSAQSLAQDLYNLLNRYFRVTVMVNSTDQLGHLLNGEKLSTNPTEIGYETIQNAVVINTCGEAVPIPTAYCQAPYSNNSYAHYSYFLGQKTNQYNWTWASIVGYPFYYVSNTGASFSGNENGWGIYGMKQTGGSGSIAFLRGLDNQAYGTAGNAVTDSTSRQATLSQTAIDACNYYGIYPSANQTSTRALSSAIQSTYRLQIGVNIFNPAGDYLPGTLYNHVANGVDVTGSFLAIGLTRTPDIRITGLSLLSYYHPRLYPANYNNEDLSKLVVLQLGLVGGV